MAGFYAQPATAQQAGSAPATGGSDNAFSREYVQENELRTCLTAENKAFQRYSELQTRADALRQREDVLAREVLLLEQTRDNLRQRPNDAAAVARFNEQVDSYNQASDELAQGKQQFEADTAAFEAWRKQEIEPACASVGGKPVPPITAYYACNMDKPFEEFTKLPYCAQLPEKAALQACVAKSNSKVRAYLDCFKLP